VTVPAGPKAAAFNPFLKDAEARRPAFNPFDPGPMRPAEPRTAPAPGGSGGAGPDPFGAAGPFAPLRDNPFAPPPRRDERPGSGAPRKLALLGRGLGIFGSYARVLLVDEEPAAYCQFGPLSAYPRALQLRDLYPQLPTSPLPAVITCIASTAAARGRGHAIALVHDVCEVLADRGFSAVEAYPEAGAGGDATSAAVPAFWERAGFRMAVADPRFPVMRREL
jgi:GNAT superfamily N-acetyltransferase